MVATPLKFAAGVKTTFVPEMPAVPLVGLTERIVSVSPFGSESFESTGTATEIFFGVEAKSSTATGGKLLTTLVTGGVMLFVGFGSVVGLPMLAVFVMPPFNGAVTVSVKFVAAPEPRLPMLVQITWLPLNIPPLLAVTNETFAGK